jgi:2-polyprenyl-3-methyl-5-hydroxy-6-metoxy-1,4-benzoquinol methylase
MLTDQDGLKRKMAEVVGLHGEWTAMSIQLGENLNTLEPPRVDTRLTRFVQLAKDFSPIPLAETRVLDLACLEGLYAIEFALHGAEVVGIEGREDNIAKAQFAKDALGLDRLSFVQDDVRNLSPERYGMFDIVICSGILYHLDTPDMFQFAEQIARVCRRFAIVDTNYSLKDATSVEYKGHHYHGWYYREHEQRSTPEERLEHLWSSIDNVKSYWLTRPSLFNLLANIGFTSVLECHVPAKLDMSMDRITLVAIKGEPSEVLSSPATAALESERWPEERPVRVSQSHDFWSENKERITSLIPGVIRTPLKQLRDRFRGPKESHSFQPWTWSEPWKRR